MSIFELPLFEKFTMGEGQAHPRTYFAQFTNENTLRNLSLFVCSKGSLEALTISVWYTFGFLGPKEKSAEKALNSKFILGILLISNFS